METLLKLTLGVKPQQAVKLEGDLEVEFQELNADELVARHLQERFDVLEARAAIASLQNGIDTAEASFFPMLILGFTMDPTINGPFENDWFTADNWSQQSGSLSISLRLMLDPLVPGSKTRNTIAQLNAQKKLAEERLLFLYQTGEKSIRDGVKNLEKSKLLIQTKELNVRVAQRAYTLALESYNSGGIDLLEVKDAERELLQAKLSLLQEKFNYLKGRMDLEYELNIASTPQNGRDKEMSDE
jgi:outer membrane protein TolC